MKILIADDVTAKSPGLREHFAVKPKLKGRRASKKVVTPAQAGGLLVACAPRKRGSKDAQCACSGLDLRDQPEQASAILDALGIALLNRGCNAEGSALIEQALKLRRKAFGPGHPLTAASLNSHSRVLRERGDYAGAEAAIKTALQINRAVFGNQGLPVVASLVEFGVIQVNQSQYREAASSANEGLEILSVLKLTDTDRNTTRLLDIRGRAEHGLGQLETAATTFVGLLKLDRKQLGTTKHPKYATHLGNFANVKADQQKFSEAEGFYRQAIDLYLNSLDRPCHPNLIDAYANLGSLLRTRNANAADLAEAGELAHLALRLDIQVRGPSHEWVGNDYANLGRWQYDSGDSRGAVTSFSRALRIYDANVKRGRFVADHAYIAEALTWQGRVLVESERIAAAAQAQPLLEKAIELWPVHLGANTVGEGIARACLGFALFLQGTDNVPAAPLLKQGYAIVLQALGTGNPLTQRIAKWLERVSQGSKAP